MTTKGIIIIKNDFYIISPSKWTIRPFNAAFNTSLCYHFRGFFHLSSQFFLHIFLFNFLNIWRQPLKNLRYNCPALVCSSVFLHPHARELAARERASAESELLREHQVYLSNPQFKTFCNFCLTRNRNTEASACDIFHRSHLFTFAIKIFQKI